MTHSWTHVHKRDVSKEMYYLEETCAHDTSIENPRSLPPFGMDDGQGSIGKWEEDGARGEYVKIRRLGSDAGPCCIMDAMGLSETKLCKMAFAGKMIFYFRGGAWEEKREDGCVVQGLGWHGEGDWIFSGPCRSTCIGCSTWCHCVQLWTMSNLHPRLRLVQSSVTNCPIWGHTVCQPSHPLLHP
jgi:hypothetical protein